MELLLAAQGHDPAEDELGSWCLREEKVTTDMWLVAQ